MTDVAIIWKESTGDIELNGHDLTADDGLRTAVIISLFTDRYADSDDVLPDGSTNRRGWWGDAYAAVERDQIGSRLWLLNREKQLTSVLNRAREYAQEALQWLVDDGLAQSVSVIAEIIRTGVLGLQIMITKPDGTDVQYRFNKLWESV